MGVECDSAIYTTPQNPHVNAMLYANNRCSKGYACLLIATSFIPFDTGPGMMVAVIMVAAYWVSHKFITENGCEPDKAERKKVAFGCVLATYLVTIAYALFVVVFNNRSADLIVFLSQPEAWFWIGVGFVVISLFYKFILGLAIKVFSKILMKKMKV